MRVIRVTMTINRRIIDTRKRKTVRKCERKMKRKVIREILDRI